MTLPVGGRLVLMISAGIVGIVWLSLVLLQLVGLCVAPPVSAKRSHALFGVRSLERHLRVFQLLVSVFAVLCFAGDLSFSAAPPFFLSPMACSVIAKVLILCYAGTIEFLYFIFFTKALLVSHFEGGAWYGRLKFLTQVALYVFLPLGMMPLAGFYFDGVVFPDDGVCAIYCTSPSVAILFAVGNTLLSFTLLFLFVEPLRQNAEKMTGDENIMTADMTAMIRKNVLLTSISVFFTCIDCIVCCIVSFQISSYGFGSPETRNLMDWSIFVALTDVCVNDICAKLMTNVWMPEALRRYLKYKESSENQSKATAVASAGHLASGDTPAQPEPQNQGSRMGSISFHIPTPEPAQQDKSAPP